MSKIRPDVLDLPASLQRPPRLPRRRKMAQLSKAERTTLVAALTRYPLQIEGSEGYKKAEVTGGGLPLEQIDCKTMESKVG